MTGITEISEALKLLNELVRRGDEIQEDVPPSPWRNDAVGGNIMTPGTPKGLPYPNPIIAQGVHHIPNNRFIAASRSLVPAMVKGARAVMDTHEKVSASTHEKDKVYWLECSEWHLVALANAYRPALVELGWWPK